MSISTLLKVQISTSVKFIGLPFDIYTNFKNHFRNLGIKAR